MLQKNLLALILIFNFVESLPIKLGPNLEFDSSQSAGPWEVMLVTATDNYQLTVKTLKNANTGIAAFQAGRDLSEVQMRDVILVNILWAREGDYFKTAPATNLLVSSKDSGLSFNINRLTLVGILGADEVSTKILDAVKVLKTLKATRGINPKSNTSVKAPSKGANLLPKLLPISVSTPSADLSAALGTVKPTIGTFQLTNPALVDRVAAEYPKMRSWYDSAVKPYGAQVSMSAGVVMGPGAVKGVHFYDHDDKKYGDFPNTKEGMPLEATLGTFTGKFASSEAFFQAAKTQFSASSQDNLIAAIAPLTGKAAWKAGQQQFLDLKGMSGQLAKPG